jgi:hypothetical protein
MIPAQQKSVEWPWAWPWVSQCHDAPDWNDQEMLFFTVLFRLSRCPITSCGCPYNYTCVVKVSSLHTCTYILLLCNVQGHNYTHAFTYLFPWECVIPVADSSVNRSLLAVEPFHDTGIIYSPLGQRNSAFSQQKFPVFRSTGRLGSNGTYRNCCKRCRKLHMIA